MGIKVKLREKEISGNRLSLYIDYYPAILSQKTGLPTRREFLGLYIVKNPKSAIIKHNNKETLQLAEQIMQKRHSELNKPEIYSGFELEQLKIKERGEQNFVEYFEKLMNKRKASNHDNWFAAHKYLKKFANDTIKFSELNVNFFEEYKEYLLTTKSNKSDKVCLA